MGDGGGSRGWGWVMQKEVAVVVAVLGGQGRRRRGLPYSLVRLGSKTGSHNVTVVLQTPRPQQTRLMATVSSPDGERERE